MEKAIERLMDERHEAYEKALNFEYRGARAAFGSEALVLAWRAANRAYVLARDAQRQSDRAATVNFEKQGGLVFNRLQYRPRTQTVGVASTGRLYGTEALAAAPVN